MIHNISLGIDLGGTKIYAVVADERNRILGSAKHAADDRASAEETAAGMRATALDALQAANLTLDNIDYFGAAVPSPVDPATGECSGAVNMGWGNVSMLTILQDLFQRKFALGNDGDLGLLAEYHCGAARGFRSAAAFFIGTGVGGGLILNSRPVLGNKGFAGEFGHMTVKAGGRRCGCGRRGCLEAYCSKIAFCKALRKEIFSRGGKTCLPEDKFTPETRNLKSKVLVKAYDEGDPSVRKVVDKGLRMLGCSAAGICAAVAPEVIVLGGGFIEAMKDRIFPPFEESFRKHLIGLQREDVRVRLSLLGDNAVALGAALLAREGGFR